jgi:hypothetical protein
MATKTTPIQISVINQTSILTDAQITPVIKALQTQVTRDFFPVYGMDAKLTQVKQGGTPNPKSW